MTLNQIAVMSKLVPSSCLARQIVRSAPRRITIREGRRRINAAVNRINHFDELRSLEAPPLPSERDNRVLVHLLVSDTFCFVDRNDLQNWGKVEVIF